jgi:hypothetical protein
MQSSHAVTAIDVAFDDPNPDRGRRVGAGARALAEQIGLPDVVAEHVAIEAAANSAGANPAAKVMWLLGGMVLAA